MLLAACSGSSKGIAPPPWLRDGDDAEDRGTSDGLDQLSVREIKARLETAQVRNPHGL